MYLNLHSLGIREERGHVPLREKRYVSPSSELTSAFDLNGAASCDNFMLLFNKGRALRKGYEEDTLQRTP